MYIWLSTSVYLTSSLFSTLLRFHHQALCTIDQLQDPRPATGSHFQSTTNAIQNRSDDILGHFQPALPTDVISNNHDYRTANITLLTLLISPIIDDYNSILATNIDLSLSLPISQLVVECFLSNPLYPWFDLWLHTDCWHKGVLITDPNKMIPHLWTILVQLVEQYCSWVGYSRAVPESLLCDWGRLFYWALFRSLIASL